MKILIFFLGVLISSHSLSQSISVELAIEWKNEKIYLKGSVFNKDKPIPYLVITYRNLSKEKVYLEGVISDNEYYLPNGVAGLVNTNLQYDELAMRIEHYSGENYVFRINELVAEYDTLNQDIEHESAIINDDLFYLYCVLDLQRKLNVNGIGKQLRCFSYPDKDYITYREAKRLLENNPEKKSQQSSIFFLNPEEVKQQKLSLAGMMLTGGTFSFRIDDLSLLTPDYGSNTKQTNRLVLRNEDLLTNTIKVSF